MLGPNFSGPGQTVGQQLADDWQEMTVMLADSVRKHYSSLSYLGVDSTGTIIAPMTKIPSQQRDAPKDKITLDLIG